MGTSRKSILSSRILKTALIGFLILLPLASILLQSASAFQVPVPKYYLNRTPTLTSESLNPQPPPSQPETSKMIPMGSSAYFYSSPLAEGQIPASPWTLTIWAQAQPGQANTGSLTVDVSLYSTDGTGPLATIGRSTNSVPTSQGKLVFQILGGAVDVKNGNRLGLSFLADMGSQTAPSVTIWYDGQGVETLGDQSRIETTAIMEESWRQDFEVDPFAPSSINSFWQRSDQLRVVQSSLHAFSGAYSLFIADTSSAGTYARYDFNTTSNPSYPGLPPKTYLASYWLSNYDSSRGRVISFHALISDQGRTYEQYWYWSASSTTMPPTLYRGTVKSAGLYLGNIVAGAWNPNQLVNWRLHAELALGVTFQNPLLISISLQSYGTAKYPTEVYWDNIFVSSYRLTLQNGRIQEGQSNTLFLRVTGAIPSTVYTFSFTVTDPLGVTSTATIGWTTGATETSFTVSRVYPYDFGGRGGNYLGFYNVTVQQTSPVYVISAGPIFVVDHITASSGFIVGLTDRGVYSRTQTVRIQAQGYAQYEVVNITLTPVVGQQYTLKVTADPQGLVVTSWTIPGNAPTGDYAIRIMGNPTSKTIPDSDKFTVTYAVLQLSQLGLEGTVYQRTQIYQRTQSVTLTATLTYPGLLRVSNGTLGFEVRQPSGLVWLRSTGHPDPVSGTFTASFRLPADGQLGDWLLSIPAGGSVDVYGNTGPAVNESITFSVIAASLQVASSLRVDTSGTGPRLWVPARITYPDGTPVLAGKATALLEYAGQIVGVVPLTYDGPTSTWLGYYLIRETDPVGLWSVYISAQDLAGPVSNSVNNLLQTVFVDTAGNKGSSDMFAYFGYILAAGFAAFSVWKLVPRRRNVSVKIDPEKVMEAARKVESSTFFRSIRDQLKSVPVKEQ